MTDWLTEAARRPITERCTTCDGTGDVHRIDGEWLGYCFCPAGVELEGKVLPEGLHYGDDGKVMFFCGGCDQYREWIGEPADFVLGERENVCGGSPRCCP